MEIDGVGASTEATPASDGSTLGRDEFLLMLIAQLENQDPLNPQDGTEFTAQLAQFSSLEQQIATNESLQDLVGLMTADNATSLLDLLGKEVIAETPYIELDGGAHTLQFDLSGGTDATTLEIKDSTGRIVRTLQLGNLSEGIQTHEWDGLDDFGNALDPGVYSVEIDAESGGNSVLATMLAETTVTAADLSGTSGSIYLGDRVVTLADIREVHAP